MRVPKRRKPAGGTQTSPGAAAPRALSGTTGAAF